MMTTRLRLPAKSPRLNRAAKSPNRARPRTPVPRRDPVRNVLTPPAFQAPEPVSVPRDVQAIEQELNYARNHRERKTPFELYVQEVTQTPLLTPEEEISLAARIKKGDEAARDHMIRANLRLVIKIAREFEFCGLPLLDLISEGNIGLARAVELFDPAKGAKLSTYSSWWIKQSMKRALANQTKTIRLPVHMVDRLYRLRRTTHKLEEIFGREPTDEELAEEMDLPLRKLAQLRRAAMRPTSLDAPLAGEDSSRLSDVVPDEHTETPSEQLVGKTLATMVREFVTKLDARERTILDFRFGLDGGDERTLEEVGRKFGVTRERIRQVQNLALQKLRQMIEHREAIPMAA